MRRGWKWLLVGLLIVVFGGCLSIPTGNYLLFSERPFDAARWRMGDSRQRARMVADLQRGGTLHSRSRDEVLELLGPPDREFSRALEYDYVYGDLLGDWFALPFSGWRQWVRIEFAKSDDRVCAVESRD